MDSYHCRADVLFASYESTIWTGIDWALVPIPMIKQIHLMDVTDDDEAQFTNFMNELTTRLPNVTDLSYNHQHDPAEIEIQRNCIGYIGNKFKQFTRLEFYGQCTDAQLKQLLTSIKLCPHINTIKVNSSTLTSETYYYACTAFPYLRQFRTYSSAPALESAKAARNFNFTLLEQLSSEDGHWSITIRDRNRQLLKRIVDSCLTILLIGKFYPAVINRDVSRLIAKLIYAERFNKLLLKTLHNEQAATVAGYCQRYGEFVP